MSLIGALEDLVLEGHAHGTDYVVAKLAAAPGTLQQRFKSALFIGGLRGHRIGDTDLIEQPYGYVGTCRACGQIMKVPREPTEGADGVQGRAVEFDCPVGKGSK